MYSLKMCSALVLDAYPDASANILKPQGNNSSRMCRLRNVWPLTRCRGSAAMPDTQGSIGGNHGRSDIPRIYSRASRNDSDSNACLRADGHNAANAPADQPAPACFKTRRLPRRNPTRSSSPRKSARRICRMSRSASRRSARGGSTSSTSRTSTIIRSCCRRSASRPPQPGVDLVYMRGVATGWRRQPFRARCPRSASYLDEQPVTTIGGTLDVHIYDIARIECLAGPQGTLYGASTKRARSASSPTSPNWASCGPRRRRAQQRHERRHGRQPRRHDQPADRPTTRVPRRSAFYQRDAGYIDNVSGCAAYCGTSLRPDDRRAIVGCIRNGIRVDNADS